MWQIKDKHSMFGMNTFYLHFYRRPNMAPDAFLIKIFFFFLRRHFWATLKKLSIKAILNTENQRLLQDFQPLYEAVGNIKKKKKKERKKKEKKKRLFLLKRQLLWSFRPLNAVPTYCKKKRGR